MQPQELPITDLHRGKPRPVPMLVEQPPLNLCGVRHRMYNSEGGARVCSWIHLVGSLIAFFSVGILAYHGASVTWSLLAGVVFLASGLSGLIACIYRLTLTILVSMITCLISAAFSLILIAWAGLSVTALVEVYVDSPELKVVLSVQVILGVCGIAELVTDLVHAIKAIRIICCFRDESHLQRRGSKIVQMPSLRRKQRESDARQTSLVIENPATFETYMDKSSVFV